MEVQILVSLSFPFLTFLSVIPIHFIGFTFSTPSSKDKVPDYIYYMLVYK